MLGIKIRHFLFNRLFEASCYALIFGLFFSRVLLSFSIAFVFIFGLLSYLSQSSFKIKPSLNFILFPLVYGVTIFSAFNTSDFVSWQSLIIKNATLFCIPLGFLFVDELPLKNKNRLLKLFALLVFVCLMVTTINVIIDNVMISKLALESKNIKPLIGPGHVELGLLSAVGFLIMCKFFIEERKKVIKSIWFLSATVSIISLHVLAYRFGLFAIYIVSFIYITYAVVSRKKYLHGILMLLMFIFIVLTLFFSIDAFRNRIINTKADFKSILYQENPNFQSAHQRWAAMKCAAEIVKKHPWIGVSSADLSSEMQQQYSINSYLLIPENRIFIHNQLMFYASSYGIPFVFLFLFALLYLLYKESRSSYFHLMIMIPFLLHMQIDNTLEKQITASAMLFLFFLISQQNKKAIK